MIVGGDFPVWGGKKARKVFLVFFCWERTPSRGAGFRNYARAVAPVRRERRPSAVPKSAVRAVARDRGGAACPSKRHRHGGQAEGVGKPGGPFCGGLAFRGDL